MAHTASHTTNPRTERADPLGRELRSDAPALQVTVAARSRRVALCAAGAALVTWVPWAVWRVAHLRVAPVPIAILVLEVVGVAMFVSVLIALASARSGRTVFTQRDERSHTYAHAIADMVGRTRSSDVRIDLGAAIRRNRLPSADRSDRAMLAVLLEGPRRLAIVISLVVGLLLGQSPFGPPPWWAVVSLVTATAAASLATWVLTGRRAVPGCRLRWSFVAMGESLAPADVDDVSPRHWLGTIGAIVAISVAVGLRGASDRWTHGLSPMALDDRVVTMIISFAVVAAALFTLRSLAPAAPSTTFASRHLEESTARQAALAAAVVAGSVGLLAGVLPAGADSPVGDPVRVETISERDVADADG